MAIYRRPKPCATCGYEIKSDGDELAHIDWHLGRPPQPERYAKLDARPETP